MRKVPVFKPLLEQEESAAAIEALAMGWLGLGSYGAAWTGLHRLGRAMVRPGRDCLTGAVEVEETYVGGPEEGKRGRSLGALREGTSIGYFPKTLLSTSVLAPATGIRDGIVALPFL